MAQIGMQGVQSALRSWDKGSSFVDNYMKGTKIRIAKEQEKRSKRKEQFSFWASEQKEFQRQKNVYGKEQADAWASARRGSEEYEFHQIPDNIKLASTGSTITLTGEKAINAIMRINKLPDTDEGRKAAKANKDAFGYGDAMVFNISGSGDNGKINHEETRKIDTHRLKSDTSKTDIMKKQTEIEGVGKADFKDTQALRKEFQEITSDFRSVRDSYTRTKKSYQDPSAAGDLSLIFNYMKMLDPGSVVRESEFAQAEKTGSWGSRIESARLKVVRGERLAPKVRNDFFDRATKLYSGRNNQYKKTSKEFKTLAVKENIDPSKVVLDYSLTEQNNDNKDPLGLF
tara:strand:- start:1332 stop:2360 length:1029 start_codon:yes stop_codon:yes gene_type:complete